MNIIQNFFTVNHDIIYFVYGLMFFVLGLAIALQSRFSSRLELAHSLNWLAAFGFFHGFHEWGALFIPLQAEYLPAGFIKGLHYIDLTLLATSFACLFEFSITLLEAVGHHKALHLLTVGLFTGWVLVVLYPLRFWITDFVTWHASADALARYFIGLPGGFLAAYALRKYALQRIVPYNVPRIIRALRTAGIAIAVYGLATGLIVPPIPFFPGNLLNTDSFTRILIVPPQLVRAAIGLVIATATIRFLEIFNVETSRQIEAMEKQQALAAQRERIARTLHDGTIQKVYTAGLLVRSAQKLTPPETPLAGRLATAVGVLDDAIGDLRQNLSSLSQPVQPREPFRSAVQKLATDPRFSSLVEITLHIDGDGYDCLTQEGSAHLLAIVQESLANAVRHANARHVQVSVHCQENALQMSIQDDGKGIPAGVVEGNGLRNMRDRASLLHGELRVERMEKGTCVSLEVPCKDEQ
jgi:signal transduction histidine kinase